MAISQVVPEGVIGKGSKMLIRYQYGEFVEACKHILPSKINSSAIDPQEWNGNLAFKQALRIAETGSEESAKLTQTFMDQIEIDLELPESRISVWRDDVAGSYPLIPSYLSNSPTPMKNRKRIITDIAPIRLFVTTILPVWIKGPEMTKRFSAILAFVLLVQRVRPIELHCVCATTSGNTGDPFDLIDIEVPSKPLGLAHAGFVAHPAFTRCLQYSYAIHKFGTKANIPIACDVESEIMTQLGVTDQDLYFPLVDRQDILMTKPVEWIKLMINRFMTDQVSPLGWDASEVGAMKGLSK